MSRSLPALTFLALCLTAAALPAQVPDDWSIERQEWRREASEVARARLVNHYGDIRVRPAPDGEAYALANIQRHVDDPRRAQVEVRVDGAELVVAVTCPDATGQEPAAWSRRRVDLTVLVPPGTRLQVTTAAGLAEIRKTRGSLEIETETGEIRTTTYGSVDARSVHGRIQSELLSPTWEPAARFETVNGDIMLTLARNVSAVVRAETRGDLTTDFSITIERDLETGDKSALAAIGGSEASLTAKSVNGAIKLLQTSLRPQPGDAF